jgi:hypothetical protein
MFDNPLLAAVVSQSAAVLRFGLRNREAAGRRPSMRARHWRMNAGQGKVVVNKQTCTDYF